MALRLKLKVPTAVVVPANAPVAGVTLIPAGNAPAAKAYVYGAVPPEAGVIAAEYGVLNRPDANDVAGSVITAGLTTSV